MSTQPKGTDLTRLGAPAAVQPVDTATDAASLIRLALERDADVDKLERLVGLLERSQERNARAAYFAALAQFQAECPPIQKKKQAKIATRSGGSYAYDYADLGEIANTIRPGLMQHGFSYTFDADMSAGPGVLVIGCTVRHVDGHSERSTFPVPIDTEAKMSGAQKNGAALTYGRRQALLSVLGLVAVDNDIDGVDPAPAATLTESEVADLDDLVEESGADRAAFLEWLGVGSLAEIPRRDLARARRALEKKRGAR